MLIVFSSPKLGNAAAHDGIGLGSLIARTVSAVIANPGRFTKIGEIGAGIGAASIAADHPHAQCNRLI
jgi:hypothetical protein